MRQAIPERQFMARDVPLAIRLIRIDPRAGFERGVYISSWRIAAAVRSATGRALELETARRRPVIATESQVEPLLTGFEAVLSGLDRNGDPGRTPTSDLGFRKALLYAAELRGHARLPKGG